MVTKNAPARTRTRNVCLLHAMLALAGGIWTAPAAAVYLTVPYQIEYYRAFSGNYSINIRKDGLAFGDALINALAVTPMSPAVSNVKANGLCIQFTVDGSKLAADFNTTVLQYSVTHESATGGTQTDSGILDLRASNSGSSPPNTQDCGALPETNHVPAFTSSINTQVAPGNQFRRDLSPLVYDADTADTLTVSLAPNTMAKFGSVELAGNVLNYAARANVPSGSTETLGLVVSDGKGATGTTVASFTINTAPVAKDAAANAVAGQPATVDVSKWVSDADGDALTVYSLTTPTHGTAAFNGLTITYTPTAAYSGSDEFTYWISDGKGGTASAKVIAAVGAPNLPPVANGYAGATNEDTPLVVDLLTSETAWDPDGDFTVTAIPTAPAHGTVNFSGHDITYIPAPNFFGADEFVYQISDTQGATASAKITVAVTPVNDAPVVKLDPLYRKVAANGAVNVDLADNVSDPDGDAVVLSDFGGAQHGQITNGAGLSFTYTPTPEFVGTDQFEYSLDDQTGTNTSAVTGTIIFMIDKANAVPTAQNVHANASSGQPVFINLANAVSDQDPDTLSISAPSRTEHGAISVTGLVVTYTADSGFVGDDQFDYTVNDGFGGSATATVAVRIAGVTAQAGALNFNVQGGTTQTARLNGSAALTVQVVDAANQPVPGVPIDWNGLDAATSTAIVFITQEATTDADGVARASFTTNSMPTVYTITVTATDLSAESSVDATITVTSGLHAITKPNTPESALATVMDTMCPALQNIAAQLTPTQQELVARCNEILAAATDGNDAQILAALHALAPEEAAASGRMSNGFALQQLGNIGARLAALRSGASGFALSGLAFNIQGQTVPGSVLADLLGDNARGGGASADEPRAAPKWSGFISGTVGGGSKDRTSQEEGFDFRTQGLTAGVDYRYSNDVVFGGALGYARSDVNLDGNGGGMDATGFSASLYGTYYRTQSLYLDAVLNYASNSYDQTRNIDYTVGTTHVQESARSKPGGALVALSVGGGYEVAAQSGASAELSLRMNYLDSSIDAYTETGANALNLSMREQRIHVLSSSLGGRGSWPIGFKWGVLIPQLNLSWEHEFDGGAHQIKGNFANDQFRTTFAFKTDEPDRDYLQLGLGASAVLPGGTTGFVQYQTTLARNNFHDYNIALGGRVELPY